MASSDTPKFAGDLMTREVVTLTPRQTVDHLEDAMRLLRFKHFPVVDDDRVVGLVSQHEIDRSGPHATASDLMTRDLVLVSPETPLVEAGRIMLERKPGCLIVVDEEQRLLGILTEADFTRLALLLLKARAS